MKLFAVVLAAALTQIGCSPDLTCNVIHEPKPGAGCPTGYVKEKQPRFTEKSGAKEYACVSANVQKEACIDVLRPGESTVIDFGAPDSDVPPPPKKAGT